MTDIMIVQYLKISLFRREYKQGKIVLFSKKRGFLVLLGTGQKIRLVMCLCYGWRHKGGETLRKSH